MSAPTAAGGTPRITARVLLLDHTDRVLLMHARDPDDPAHHWWELPGGGIDPGETLHTTAVREVAEETGILLCDLGPCLWIRETRFRYRNREHHRREHVFLARPADTTPRTHTKPTANERAGLLNHRWWTSPNSPNATTNSSPQACLPSSTTSSPTATPTRSNYSNEEPPLHGRLHALMLLHHARRPARTVLTAASCDDLTRRAARLNRRLMARRL